MRKVIGWGILVLGTGALGLWGRGDHAQDMQAEITAAAQSVVATAQHGITASVGGRDITAIGLADSEAEKSAILASLEEVEGQRVVIDEITVIPVEKPFMTRATADSTGITVDGAVPSQTDRTVLADIATGADAMTLANGEPTDWTGAARAGLAGLGLMETGEMVIEDETVMVRGEAMTPSERDEALAALADIPGNFETDIEITTIDDGKPFTLTMDYNGTDVTGMGKLPAGVTAVDLAGGLGASDVTGDIMTARIGEGAPFGAQAQAGAAGLALLEEGTLTLLPETNLLSGTALTPTERSAAEAAVAGQDIATEIDVLDDGTPFFLGLTREAGEVTGAGKVPAGVNFAGLVDVTTSKIREGDAFGPAATAGLAALNGLENGSLIMTESGLTLDGMATTPAAADAARAQLAALPDAMTQTVNIGTLDDGTPFRMTAALADGSVSGEGKLPNGTVLPQVQGDFEIAAIGAGDSFQGASDAGLSALRLLDSGTLAVEGDVVTLRGDAADPEVASAAQKALATLPAPYTADVDLNLLDDGLPVDYSVSYDPANGVALTGKTPTGLTADAVADALGFDEVNAADAVMARNDGDASGTLAALGQLSGWMGELSGFDIKGDATTAAATAFAAHGVDAGQLAGALEGVTVEGPRDTPEAGAVRTNLRTGAEERFANVAWIPELQFEADVVTCAQLSNDILAANKVNFVTGGSDLDARSVRTINDLSAVAHTCLGNGDMSLIIGGHTDSSGSLEGNNALSQRRADAVRDALIARGLDAGAMNALGFGPSEPIATNDTEEGRAANRRTTFQWMTQ